MAPSVLMDTSDDFVMPTAKALPSSKRTLLLSPPSLSSHQEKLNNVLEMHNRAVTDMQMLDRLALGLVSLPQATYDLITILSDADGSRRESQALINRDILNLLVQSLKSGGQLRSQDGLFGSSDGPERNEAILAGLSIQAGVGFVKPDYSVQESVPLKFGRKKTAQAAGGLNTPSESVSLPLNGKRKSVDVGLAGVGFDDGMDDLSDDELIDEDTLLDEDDLKRPIKIREWQPWHFHYLLRPNVDFFSQPPNANQRQRGAGPVKIALVDWRRSWRPKIEPEENRPTKPSTQ